MIAGERAIPNKNPNEELDEKSPPELFVDPGIRTHEL